MTPQGCPERLEQAWIKILRLLIVNRKHNEEMAEAETGKRAPNDLMRLQSTQQEWALVVGSARR